MAPVIYEGLRKSTDPIYKQVSIVLGSGAKRRSQQNPEESGSESVKPKKKEEANEVEAIVKDAPGSRNISGGSDF